MPEEIDTAIGAVEIKITAHEHDEDHVLALLAKAKGESESLTVYFFDTPELSLFENGLVLRARKRQGNDDETTVKLRPVDPATIPKRWLENNDFEVEMDRVGDKEVTSAKLGSPQSGSEIDETVAGDRPLRKLFNEDQEQLIAELGPSEFGWDGLVTMGPIAVSKWKIEPADFGREITVERWELPDGSDLVELSIKVEPKDATQASEEFLRILQSFNLDIGGDQQTKTRGALLFFTTGASLD